jgi:opacity protein-like surface antigen
VLLLPTVVKMRSPAKVASIHIYYGVFMKNRLFLGLLAFLTVPACAEGLYVFGDIGEGHIFADIGPAEVYATDTSFSAGVGYTVNNIYAFEAAYREIGTFTLFKNQNIKTSADGSAIQVSVLAKHPISDIVSVYGRLGVARLTYDLTVKDFNFPEDSETDTQAKNKMFVGVGASYKLNEQVDLRIEYNRNAKFDDVISSSLTLGVAYWF